jgi:tetratricopeptide (TPR) repeat protein
MLFRFACAGLLGAVLPLSAVQAQQHSRTHHHHHPGSGSGGSGPVVSSAPFYLVAPGPYGPFTFVPPQIVVGPNGVATLIGMPPPPPKFDSGKSLAGPPPSDQMKGLTASPGVAKTKSADVSKAAHYVTLGDRLFRAGNAKRAAERYEQAARTDPRSAAPRVRLAQIALLRGQFAEAAKQYREAQTAEPGWVVTANDIQSIYAEPGDFAKQIAKLESHLQSEPEDRDGWLVLGAQLYLSGRTQRSADVFLRLSDRKPDAVLASFLEATSPRTEPDAKGKAPDVR